MPAPIGTRELVARRGRRELPGDGDWRGLLLVNELTGEMRSLVLQAQLVQ